MRRSIASVRPLLHLVLFALGMHACDGSAGARREEGPAPRLPVAAKADPPAGEPSVVTPAPNAAPAAPVGKPAGKVLKAPGPFEDLPIDGHPTAVVSLPLGADSSRPVVVATHGNYDRPEWQCEVWREILGTRAFILCPRGIARPDSPSPDDIRFTYASNQVLEREVHAGLAALRARYPDHAAAGAVLYTGFSLGAIMGIPIAARSPSVFPRLVLVEGGHDRWSPDTAKAFAAGGGQRVLFVCSQPGCAAGAKTAASRLEKAGVLVKVVRGPDAGHRYDGPVAEQTSKALPWVLEGDTQWP
jgi:hypothetical protein